MNITLSADDKLVEKTRAYAARHGTSLNELIRERMRQIAGQADAEQKAVEFTELAVNQGGRSDDDFTFNREEAHRR